MSVYGGIQGRVALEALQGDKTIQEIAAGKHKVHPNHVSSWKRQAVDGCVLLFALRLPAPSDARNHGGPTVDRP